MPTPSNFRLTIVLMATALGTVGCGSNAPGPAPSSSAASATGDGAADDGYECYERQDYQRAIDQFQKALESQLVVHNKSDVLTSIGNCYSELENFDESLRYHDLALAENEQNYKAHVNKGIVYRLLERYDEAEACYNKALAIKPDYAELHASLGALAIYQGKSPKAIEHLRKSIQLDGTLAVAHANLSLALAMEGNFEEAERELQTAEKMGYANGVALRKRMADFREEK